MHRRKRRQEKKDGFRIRGDRRFFRSDSCRVYAVRRGKISGGAFALARAEGGRADAVKLFIDEGFGTLDEKSVADALDILSAVNADKNLIGIISHVALLRENIPRGIEVKKSSEGSSIRVYS